MLLYCNNMFSSNDKLSNLKNNLERNSVKTTNILTSIASISKKKKKIYFTAGINTILLTF